MTLTFPQAAPAFADATTRDAPETDGLVRGAREHGTRNLLRLLVAVITSGFLFAFVGSAAGAIWLAVVFALEASVEFTRRRLAAGDTRLSQLHIGGIFSTSLCWVAQALMLWNVAAEVPRIAAMMALFTVTLYGAIGGHKDWRLLAALITAPMLALFALITDLVWTTTSWPIASLATLATLGSCATIALNGVSMFRSDRAATLANAALFQERAALERRVDERTVALRAALAQANAASVAKSQFLAAMSHELRTPLNAVIGYAELITDDLRSDPARANPEDGARIVAAGRNLLTMVNDILDYANLESGEATFNSEPVDLRALLETLRAEATALATSGGNVLSTVISDGVGMLATDRMRLHQCLTILVGNACKFTQNGEIRLAATRSADARHIDITVSDTGPGIAPDLREHIFEPFVQGDGSATRTHEGAGLGLATARRLALLLGGELTLRADVRRGASFLLRLPLR